MHVFTIVSSWGETLHRLRHNLANWIRWKVTHAPLEAWKVDSRGFAYLWAEYGSDTGVNPCSVQWDGLLDEYWDLKTHYIVTLDSRRYGEVMTGV